MKNVFILLLILTPLLAYSSETETIDLNDGDVLENVTLGNDSNIVIEGNANVTIKNCVIETNNKIAIHALPGDGAVTISDSIITSRTGKGLYIERGRKINISRSKIQNCREEGIDLRASISGTVNECFLTRNGESGIELIAGNSDLEVRDNNFEENGASGLAIQFYSFISDEGRIKISKNIFSDNKKYGIDCAVPQGQRPPAYYWNDSINLVNNNFSSNNLGKINKSCDYTGPVDEEDKKILEKVAAEFESANVGYKDRGLLDSIWSFLTNMWLKIVEL